MPARKKPPTRTSPLPPEEKARVLRSAEELMALGWSPAEFLENAASAQRRAASFFVNKVEVWEGREFPIVELQVDAIADLLCAGAAERVDPLYAPGILEHAASLRRRRAYFGDEPDTSAMLIRLARSFGVRPRTGKRRRPVKTVEQDRWDYGKYLLVRDAVAARLGLRPEKRRVLATKGIVEIVPSLEPWEKEVVERMTRGRKRVRPADVAALAVLATVRRRRNDEIPVSMDDLCLARTEVQRLEHSLRRL